MMSDGKRVRRKDVITRKEENSVTKKIFGEFNKVFVSGRVETDFEYSHQFGWEKFYCTRLLVERKSGEIDFIPLIVSELLLEDKAIKGKWLEVAGQLRTHKKLGEDGKKHLNVFLFAAEIKVYKEEFELEEVANSNQIYLEGYLCKLPVYRTPIGREITTILIIVNRAHSGSDCIPCIIWGRWARWARDFEIGTKVQLYGRVQSRINLNRGNPREICEVSVMRINKL